MSWNCDLVVVGGGISGAALPYTTAKFTDIDSIALIEKESEIGAINTKHTDNSQTIHFGDLETNYSFDKAKEVKDGDEIMTGYLENHDPERELHAKRSKMALAVGNDGVEDSNTDTTRRGSRTCIRDYVLSSALRQPVSMCFEVL